MDRVFHRPSALGGFSLRQRRGANRERAERHHDMGRFFSVHGWHTQGNEVLPLPHHTKNNPLDQHVSNLRKILRLLLMKSQSRHQQEKKTRCIHLMSRYHNQIEPTFQYGHMSWKTQSTFLASITLLTHQRVTTSNKRSRRALTGCIG